MRKVLAFPFSVIHFFLMFTLLGIFHPIQVVAYTVFGYSAHKRAVDLLNFLLVQNLYTLLCRPSFYGFNELPKNQPLIIVSNHQSMYDISPVVWGFRKHHTKFISKKELGKNLPSISYNLRKGGSVLIDRHNGSQSIREILKLGKNMEERNWSVCIFPEGTRSKTGQLKEFQLAGFKTLLKAAPSALVVPLVIDGNYKLHKWGQFPLNIGLWLTYTALQPVERIGKSDEELLVEVKSSIQKQLEVRN
ncbi:MAG: lysophospholipid acyltransferase family protein [Salinivirgaceae bacterium]|jgi:1-acyl-sn-glycerol-3-phosphate acyltransferase